MNKDILKWVLIAAGAYLLYRWLSDNGYLSQFGIGTSSAQALPAPATTAQPQPDTGVQPTGTAPGAGTAEEIAAAAVAKYQADQAAAAKAAADAAARLATAAPSATRDLVAVLSQGDSFLSGGGANGHGPFEHWNYYYNQTPQGKALPAPDPGTAGVDPNASITLDQWWALVSAHGISGIPGLNGGFGSIPWQRGPWGVV